MQQLTSQDASSATSRGRKPGLTLITGASAGIGAALGAEFARHGHNLVLVARGEERLREVAGALAAEHGVQAHVVVADLAEGGAAHRLHEQVTALGLEPAIVVNNAGAGTTGAFSKQTVAEGEQLIRLNIEALTSISSLFLPPMLAAGYGRILNVASVAGFQPVPAMATYAASKAYVLSLTEGMDEELHGSGVRVGALCPGLTDTEMAADMTDLARAGGSEVPRLILSSPQEVAREGYAACMAGETVRVPGTANRLAAMWSQTQPRWLVRTLGGVLGRQLLRR